MNWYKFSKDFSDRNLINSKIKYLEGVKKTLSHIKKLIFQSGKNAKAANYKIISSVKISSYPTLHDILMQADELALDSPWKFAALCEEGIGKINKLISGLKKEREKIVRGDKNTSQKGSIDMWYFL